MIDTVESYKLTYATVEMNISSNEDIEEIKKELDKRKELNYSIDENKKIIKLYYLK